VVAVRFKLASFRTRVFAVKLLLLDHGELVKALGLDDELVQRGSSGENIDSEISRQAAILQEYETLYAKVCAASRHSAILPVDAYHPCGCASNDDVIVDITATMLPGCF
jgi:hypothetical protein